MRFRCRIGLHRNVPLSNGDAKGCIDCKKIFDPILYGGVPDSKAYAREMRERMKAELDGLANKQARPPEPSPVTCIICGKSYSWDWDDYDPDDAEWVIGSEQWKAQDGREGLVCSRRCWLKTGPREVAGE